MAHYAELDENNVVLRVVVIDNEVEGAGNLEEQEVAGSIWCGEFFGGGIWKKTSYSGNMRKNYAGIGYAYDAIRDAFVQPEPPAAETGTYTFNEETCRWDYSEN